MIYCICSQPTSRSLNRSEYMQTRPHLPHFTSQPPNYIASSTPAYPLIRLPFLSTAILLPRDALNPKIRHAGQPLLQRQRRSSVTPDGTQTFDDAGVDVHAKAGEDVPPEDSISLIRPRGANPCGQVLQGITKWRRTYQPCSSRSQAHGRPMEWRIRRRSEQKTLSIFQRA